MEEGIRINNVSKIYQQGAIAVPAVSDLTLEIAPGEFSSLYGPSGSGKTTLLNLIGGLDQPSSGTISVAGKRIDQMSRAERADFRLHNIGFVFQAYNLIPVLSAQENVEFVMELQGIASTDRRAKALQILDEVGLGGLAARKPAELSGGQQQRVAVARAIVGKPHIVLADEPTANLDSKTAASLLDMMKVMNQKYNVTFVFSTHDHLVMENAKRLIQLKDGKIVSDQMQ